MRIRELRKRFRESLEVQSCAEKSLARAARMMWQVTAVTLHLKRPLSSRTEEQKSCVEGRGAEGIMHGPVSALVNDGSDETIG